MPDDLVVQEGVDDEGEHVEGDVVGEPALLDDGEPASPEPIDVPKAVGPGQELAEGEG